MGPGPLSPPLRRPLSGAPALRNAVPIFNLGPLALLFVARFPCHWAKYPWAHARSRWPPCSRAAIRVHGLPMLLSPRPIRRLLGPPLRCRYPGRSEAPDPWAHGPASVVPLFAAAIRAPCGSGIPWAHGLGPLAPLFVAAIRGGGGGTRRSMGRGPSDRPLSAAAYPSRRGSGAYVWALMSIRPMKFARPLRCRYPGPNGLKSWTPGPIRPRLKIHAPLGAAAARPLRYLGLRTLGPMYMVRRPPIIFPFAVKMTQIGELPNTWIENPWRVPSSAIPSSLTVNPRPWAYGPLAFSEPEDMNSALWLCP